jgi:hypothetical protein
VDCWKTSTTREPRKILFQIQHLISNGNLRNGVKVAVIYMVVFEIDKEVTERCVLVPRLETGKRFGI